MDKRDDEREEFVKEGRLQTVLDIGLAVTGPSSEALEEVLELVSRLFGVCSVRILLFRLFKEDRMVADSSLKRFCCSGERGLLREGWAECFGLRV